MALAPIHPRLFGNGIDDDTDALNALFARLPVDIVGDDVRLHRADGLIELSGGTFAISDTVFVQGNASVSWCTFQCVGWKDDRAPMVSFERGARLKLGRNEITSARSTI